MATWPISLRGSTVVIDLDPPSGDLAVSRDEPATGGKPQACEQQLAPAKPVSQSGTTYRSYGGTPAAIRKRLRTPASDEVQGTKKGGLARSQLEIAAGALDENR
jgi:hypothetical protein